MATPITLTKDQAMRLWTSAMAFSDSWREQEARFEPYGEVEEAFDGIEVEDGWTFHWCQTSADQVLLEAFFVSEGIEVRPLWDLALTMATIEAGSRGAEDPYVVLAQVPSDYANNNAYWKV